MLLNVSCRVVLRYIGQKAKARTEGRIRVRGGVIRVRKGEARTRTVRRITAEQYPTECFCRWYVRVVVVTEPRGRATADGCWHDVAPFAEDDSLDVALVSRFVADMHITCVTCITELRRIVADEYL